MKMHEKYITSCTCRDANVKIDTTWLHSRFSAFHEMYLYRYYLYLYRQLHQLAPTNLSDPLCVYLCWAQMNMRTLEKNCIIQPAEHTSCIETEMYS